MGEKQKRKCLLRQISLSVRQVSISIFAFVLRLILLLWEQHLLRALCTGGKGDHSYPHITPEEAQKYLGNNSPLCVEQVQSFFPCQSLNILNKNNLQCIRHNN